MQLRWWDKKEDPRLLSEESEEVWTPISEYYAVSNLGRATSKAQGSWKLMTLSVVNTGYIAFNFPHGTNFGATAHRAVVRAFDGDAPAPEYTDVRHLDGNKANNLLYNLKWGTRSENMRDVLEHRKLKGLEEKEIRIEEAEAEGVWYGGRSWDTELVQILLDLESRRRIIKSDIAVALGVSRDTIDNIIRGQRPGQELRLGETTKQKRRGLIRKAEIMDMLKQGKKLKEINNELNETLTAQDLYYYKTAIKREEGKTQ